MNREQRRELAKRKWLSRARRIYYSYSYWYQDNPSKRNRIEKRCESITDFLDKVKFSKLLKKTAVTNSYVSDQMDNHREIKKERQKSKDLIREGILEYAA